jgi:hypothetical protein
LCLDASFSLRLSFSNQRLPFELFQRFGLAPLLFAVARRESPDREQ